jgi:hypothetical protein
MSHVQYQRRALPSILHLYVLDGHVLLVLFVEIVIRKFVVCFIFECSANYKRQAKNQLLASGGFPFVAEVLHL